MKKIGDIVQYSKINRYVDYLIPITLIIFIFFVIYFQSNQLEHFFEIGPLQNTFYGVQLNTWPKFIVYLIIQYFAFLVYSIIFFSNILSCKSRNVCLLLRFLAIFFSFVIIHYINNIQVIITYFMAFLTLMFMYNQN